MTDSPTDPSDVVPLRPLLPGGGRPEPERSAVITYLSVAMMMLGVLGTTCCGVVGGYTGLREMANPTFTLPDGSVFYTDPAVAKYMFAQGTADFVLSLALLAAGLGGFYLKPWARKVGVVACAMLLVSGAVLAVAQVRWVGPYMANMADRQAAAELAATRAATTTTATAATTAAASPAASPAAETRPAIPPADAAAAVRSQGSTFYIVMYGLRSIVPVLVLATWTRRPVREEFARGLPPAA